MGSNARKAKPQLVPVNLDKERHLLYDMNAFIELEDQFGSIELALEELSKGKVRALRAILHVGLMHEDETLTVKQVGALVGLGDLEELSEALNKAIISALPELADGAKSPNA